MKVGNGSIELELTETDIKEIIIEPDNKAWVLGLIRATIEDNAGGKFTPEQLDILANKVYDDIRSQGGACQEIVAEL